MRPPQSPLPGFLVIGAQRCATRWLRSNLSQHPDIFMPPFELSFFTDGHLVRKGGATRYREKFDGWEDEPWVGELSTGYLLWGNDPGAVAARIKEMMPDVRLIAMVRQPLERMYSAMLDQIKRGRLSADADLFTMVTEGDPAVDELDLVRGGWYAQSLAPYQHLFGEQLLVLTCDDVKNQPEKVFEAALRHIGARPDFVADHLDRLMFSNKASVRVTGPKLDRRKRRILYDLYRDDVDELSAMIGRDLSAWDPGPPRSSVR